MFGMVAFLAQRFQVFKAMGFRAFLVVCCQFLSRPTSNALISISHLYPELQFGHF
jgi:hypothetical protein